MTRRPLALVLIALVLGAGCLSATPDARDAPVEAASAPAAGDAVRVGAASGLAVDGERFVTLDAAPEWRVGEWWRIRFEETDTGEVYEFDRVVVGRAGDDYLVGVNVDEWQEMPLIIHAPGLDRVNAATLEFEMHDHVFTPLRFPVVDGDAWTTSFLGVPDVDVRVLGVDDGRVDVATTGSFPGAWTYDARLGALSMMESPGSFRYEVIDHGYGYEGVVRVPFGMDVALCAGSIVGVVAVRDGCTASVTGVDAPVRAVELAGDYDRASAALILLDVVGAPVAAGVYHIRVTPPDGEVRSATKLPSEPGMVTHAFAVEEPLGAWDVAVAAAGAGGAFVEVMGYRALEVQLPEGCVVKGPEDAGPACETT